MNTISLWTRKLVIPSVFLIVLDLKSPGTLNSYIEDVDDYEIYPIIAIVGTKSDLEDRMSYD